MAAAPYSVAGTVVGRLGLDDPGGVAPPVSSVGPTPTTFVGKYSVGGQLQWVRTMGRSWSMARRPLSADPTTGALAFGTQTVTAKGPDMIVAAIDKNGTLTWAGAIGGETFVQAAS
jgi:hypothetical protein